MVSAPRLLVLLLAINPFGRVLAQDQQLAALARVSPGRLVRLHVVDSGSVQGRLLRADRETIIVVMGPNRRSGSGRMPP